MITDEKRRDVAKRLRILASHAPADKDYVLDALGLYPGEYIDGFDPYCVNELADLIDRPTCKTILARELRTAYGKPITGINVYILSCGHQAVGFEKPRYCPVCGRKVVSHGI